MQDDTIRTALKMIPYGFYAITSKGNDDVNAMVANWLTQVSFEPRLVTLGLQKTCYTHQLVEEGQVFTINIFHKDDRDAIMPFTKGRAKNPDKMKQATYTPAPETGCPVLEGAGAYIECKVVQIIDVGGDHDLVVGDVVNAAVLKEFAVEDTLSLPELGWSYAG